MAGPYANLLVMNGIIHYTNKAQTTKPRAGWGVLALALLLVVAIAGCGSGESETATNAVYDFPIVFYQGQDEAGAEMASLSELRGQPIVLNFWAGQCPPCRAEMPEFQSFADEYAGRALVIGVDLGQFFSLGNQDDAVKLLNELSVRYPAGYTDDAGVLPELGVTGLPATFFIAADGNLHRKWLGVLNGEKLAEITDEMLAQ